jgi:hypothetical protein
MRNSRLSYYNYAALAKKNKSLFLIVLDDRKSNVRELAGMGCYASKKATVVTMLERTITVLTLWT